MLPTVESRMNTPLHPDFFVMQGICGHGVFGSYLHKFRRRDDPSCSCGAPQQTPQHFMDCLSATLMTDQLPEPLWSTLISPISAILSRTYITAGEPGEEIANHNLINGREPTQDPTPSPPVSAISSRLLRWSNLSKPYLSCIFSNNSSCPISEWWNFGRKSFLHEIVSGWQHRSFHK